jgi:vancomycin resistance protein YoaR
VLGVDLGGRSRAAAAAALRTAVAERRAELTAPVRLRVGGRHVDVRPADIGLAVDVAGTVARISDPWPNPVASLWRRREVRPVVSVDPGRLHAALGGPAAAVTRPMTRPAIRFTGGEPYTVPGRSGRGLDPARSAAAVRAAWPFTDAGARLIDVPVVDLHPRTSAEELDRLLRDVARPAVAAPVAIRLGSRALTLSPVSVAQSLLLEGDTQGEVVPRVDPSRLRTALGAQLDGLERRPVQARILIAGRRPKVVASSPGRMIDMVALARDVEAVLPAPPPREAPARFTAVPAATRESDLARLGIRQRVSTFTTYFDGGSTEPRSRNIIRAAREVDGAIVKPGETFSLNGHTGPRGYAEGYVDAAVIVRGRLVPGVGGGISQFATTLFNAAYYAGLEDVEHQPHSYWFSRYPPVIESTIFYPTLDLKFRNNTPYGVLIDTSYTGRSITVTMWSTRVYDKIVTRWGPRRAPTKPKRIRLAAGKSCIATEGIDGFTQDAWRIFRRGGKEIRREKFTWRYDAEPRYVCGR